MIENPAGPSSEASDANAEAIGFLERLLESNPALRAAALASEVDTLLGRVAPPKASAVAKRWASATDDDPDDAPDFGWYSHLLSLTPPVDDEYIEEAARRVEVGLLAEERLALLDPAQSSRRELAELHTLRREGREAWRFMVLSNLRLVFHWSKGVARSVDSDWAQDAFQVGCIGLIRGLQGWDYKLGYKLSTFVSWHVRQAIQRWRANEVMIIRVPVHVWEALGSDDGELTDALRQSAERAQDLASIEAMVDDRGEDAPWDGGLEDLEARIDRERAVSALLSGLDERSLDVIERRFGMREDLDGPMTLDEIGAVWGVTRERIRQLEKKILDALRDKAAGRPSSPIGSKRVRRKKPRSDELDARAGDVPMSNTLPS